jgi:quercetin dioxygenase-like cupin family protein
MAAMRHDEAKHWARGTKTASFYEERLAEERAAAARDEGLMKVVRPEDMPWEICRQGKIKHIVNEKMPVRIKTVDAYIQELAPGSRSGKHRHMAEEVLFILEGRGYDLHWDVDFEVNDAYVWKADETPKRFEWEAGDIVYIPPNTIHQHFNLDPDRPARFIAAMSRVYRFIGFGDIEQLEDAPEYTARERVGTARS